MVYTQNTIPKMLEGKPGKHYTRALRASLLTDAALHQVLLQSIQSDTPILTEIMHQLQLEFSDLNNSLMTYEDAQNERKE